MVRRRLFAGILLMTASAIVQADDSERSIERKPNARHRGRQPRTIQNAPMKPEAINWHGKREMKTIPPSTPNRFVYSSKRSKSSKKPPANVPAEISIRIPKFSIAYAIPELMEAPAATSIETLREATEKYWVKFFKALFGERENVSFLGLDLNTLATSFSLIGETLTFSVEFSMALSYMLGTINPPSAKDTLGVMRLLPDFYASYVSGTVQTIPDFSSTEAVVIEEVPRELDSLMRVDIAEYTFFYEIPDLERDLEASQRDQLAVQTSFFWTSRLQFKIPQFTIGSVETEVVEALWNPSNTQNHQVLYKSVFFLTRTTQSSSASVPTPEELFLLMSSTSLDQYATLYVRALPSFSSTTTNVAVGMGTVAPATTSPTTAPAATTVVPTIRGTTVSPTPTNAPTNLTTASPTEAQSGVTTTGTPTSSPTEATTAGIVAESNGPSPIPSSVPSPSGSPSDFLSPRPSSVHATSSLNSLPSLSPSELDPSTQTMNSLTWFHDPLKSTIAIEPTSTDTKDLSNTIAAVVVIDNTAPSGNGKDEVDDENNENALFLLDYDPEVERGRVERGRPVHNDDDSSAMLNLLDSFAPNLQRTNIFARQGRPDQ